MKSINILIITILTVYLSSVLFAPNVVAIEVTGLNNDWSWSGGAPEVDRSRWFYDIPTDRCLYSIKTFKVAYSNNLKNGCISINNGVMFGHYSAMSRYVPVVSVGIDDYAYELNGVCSRPDLCFYSSVTDTLFANDYGEVYLGKGLFIYKNFKKRLIPKLNSYMELSYDFDKSNPDYVLNMDNGSPWPIGGMNVSKNGRYVVFEILNHGTGLIDVETMNMRKVIDRVFPRYIGTVSSSEYDITDDGKFVVMSGVDSGFTFVNVTDDCGIDLINVNIFNNNKAMIPCDDTLVDASDVLNNFRTGYRPRFNYSGGELSMVASNFNNEYFKVNIKAHNYQSETMDYIALGDSFSSGEGELEDDYYKIGTNTESERCHTSLRSYPYLISNASFINPLKMESVACSGARTVDINDDNKEKYQGQGDRLNDGDLNTIYSQKVTAIDQFIPGRVNQIEFVEKYRPKIVTVGIGGNDVNLVGKLKDCLVQYNCEWVYTDSGKARVAEEIKNIFPTLVNTYKNINTKSPETKIYAIGYPKIIKNNSTFDCKTFYGAMLRGVEREFANEAIVYLNQVIEAAAKRAGVKYISIEDSFGDQLLCGTETPSAMNSIRYGDDFNPIFDSLKSKILGTESFHPTPVGHQLGADMIIESINNLNTYQYCADGSTICPDDDIQAPEPSIYWQSSEPVEFTKQRYVTYSVLVDNILSVNLENYSLLPNSKVILEIHSNPVMLGEYEVNENGGLFVDLLVPDELSEGVHNIHIFGKTFSGDDIDLYDVIEYVKLKNDNLIIVDDLTTQSPIPVSDGSEETKAPDSIIINHSSSDSSDDRSIVATVNEVDVYDSRFDIEKQEVVGYGSNVLNSEILGSTSNTSTEVLNDFDESQIIKNNILLSTVGLMIIGGTIFLIKKLSDR